MKQDPHDKEIELSPLAIGYMWSIQIISLGIEFVLFVLLGLWLDRTWHTSPVFILIGTVVGMISSMKRLMALVLNDRYSDGVPRSGSPQSKTSDDTQKNDD